MNNNALFEVIGRSEKVKKSYRQAVKQLLYLEQASSSACYLENKGEDWRKCGLKVQ